MLSVSFVCKVLSVMAGVWCVVWVFVYILSCGVVCSVQNVLCVWYVVCSVWCKVCGVLCVVCGK